MEAYGGMELQPHSFFNLGDRWGGRSNPRVGRFTPGGGDPVQDHGLASGPFWTGTERIVKPAASRYTDWAIGATIECSEPQYDG